MKKSLLLSTVLLGGLVLSAQQQAVRLPLEALEKSEIKVLERVETNEKSCQICKEGKNFWGAATSYYAGCV